LENERETIAILPMLDMNILWFITRGALHKWLISRRITKDNSSKRLKTFRDAKNRNNLLLALFNNNKKTT